MTDNLIKNHGTSIIILSYNNLNYTKQCLECIRKYTHNENYEIIVIDNNSNEETKNWLKTQYDIKLQLNTYNRGFPGGCNDGIKLANPLNDILLLNNDIVVTYNWLTNLKIALYSNDNIGAVSPVTNSSSYWQSIPTTYKTLNEMQEFAYKINISDKTKWEERIMLVGYSMLIKKEVLDKVGLLDEIYFPGNFEDDDYCFRIINAEYKLLLCHDTFVHHYGSASFSTDSSYNEILQKNKRKFEEKWNIDISDVYFNLAYLAIIPEINDLKVLDWIDSLEYIKEKTPGKNCNFFKIMDKCYEPSMEGDKHLFNEMEIYDNVEIYETDKNPEKYFNNIVEFINQGFFYSEDKRIFS